MIVLKWAGYICLSLWMMFYMLFSKMIATQFNTQVKVFHFDNGHEFVN